MKYQHQPVLESEVVRLLNPQPGESYFDATAGYGGHAAAIMQLIGQGGRVVLVDQDSQAMQQLQQRFGGQAEIRRANFLEAARDLAADGSLFDLILVDLGVSSPQIDNPERGFSFKAGGPLDMRMDQSGGLTADTVVNHYREAELADVIWRYGEERRSRRIAKAIVAKRPIADTAELAKIVRSAVGVAGDIDPATRTFQAIRIEVNGELEALEATLPILGNLLTIGGRLAVISFHSLEDRLVKAYIDRESRDCICPPKQPVCTCDHVATLAKLTRKPISGTLDSHNPRARSAKLRVACKLKPKQKEDT